MKKIIYFLIFTFFLSIISFADEKNIQVIDGDTIHIEKLKYRFFGIDAPDFPRRGVTQIVSVRVLIFSCGDF